MPDFTRIDYLKDGNERQKKAYEILTKYHVLEKMKDYSPILAGTVPIEIDIKGSDLDLIFQVDLEYKQDFLDDLLFCQLISQDTEVEHSMVNGEECITLNCMLEGFPIEIFGQNKPTVQQNAYLHMVAEYKILQEKGEKFKQKIIDLKKQGIKTEPAFGMLLGLENPYEDLLKF